MTAVAEKRDVATTEAVETYRRRRAVLTEEARDDDQHHRPGAAAEKRERAARMSELIESEETNRPADDVHKPKRHGGPGAHLR